eukprot:5280847-Amphidinium_carterae.1
MRLLKPLGLGPPPLTPDLQYVQPPLEQILNMTAVPLNIICSIPLGSWTPQALTPDPKSHVLITARPFSPTAEEVQGGPPYSRNGSTTA